MSARKPMYTIVEAAARLSVGRSTMYALLKSGQVASVGVGADRRVPDDALVAFQREKATAVAGTSTPIGVDVSTDLAHRADRNTPYQARVRWTDPATNERESTTQSFESEEDANDWLTRMRKAAIQGVSPSTANMTLGDYGDLNMELVLRDVERSTTDPYKAGWRKRALPSLGHLPLTMLTYGAVDRAVNSWISEGCSRSTIKNSLAVLVRVMQQAVRDGIVERNPARITGWQRQYELAEDELDDPRALALPSWHALTALADALVEESAGTYRGWGDVVIFEACTATRIGEVSGVRAKDIDTDKWIWTVRRQTTPAPGGLIDKNTKGKRAREVPIIAEIRDLVQDRLAAVNRDPEARLFTGPRGGRITTAVLRDATHWDNVVTKLGYEHLRRHDLRHTGLTWMADAGVPVHHLQKIAGHGQLTTTQRYLHPSRRSVTDAGELLSKHLQASAPGANLRAV